MLWFDRGEVASSPRFCKATASSAIALNSRSRRRVDVWKCDDVEGTDRFIYLAFKVFLPVGRAPVKFVSRWRVEPLDVILEVYRARTGDCVPRDKRGLFIAR